jgi:hypothetical protein
MQAVIVSQLIFVWRHVEYCGVYPRFGQCRLSLDIVLNCSMLFVLFLCFLPYQHDALAPAG